MNPDIGDILDCRKVSSLGHFVLALGIRKYRGKEEIMYYEITSRVYAVFPKIVDFFNDCLSRKYERFAISFPKEKKKERISLHGRLCDAFFLDMESNYKGCLDVDSMIVINKDPEIIDIETYGQWHSNGLVTNRSRLEISDMLKFISQIKASPSLSEYDRCCICKNFKELKISSIKKPRQ